MLVSVSQITLGEFPGPPTAMGDKIVWGAYRQDGGAVVEFEERRARDRAQKPQALTSHDCSAGPELKTRDGQVFRPRAERCNKPSSLGGHSPFARVTPMRPVRLFWPILRTIAGRLVGAAAQLKFRRSEPRVLAS
jgi:hypothetical protein